MYTLLLASSLSTYQGAFLWHRENIKSATSNGFAIAFTGAARYCVYAAAWRLAAHLVIQGRFGIFEVFR